MNSRAKEIPDNLGVGAKAAARYMGQGGWYDVDMMLADWRTGDHETPLRAVEWWSPTLFRQMTAYLRRRPWDEIGLFRLVRDRQERMGMPILPPADGNRRRRRNHHAKTDAAAVDAAMVRLQLAKPSV